MLSVNTVSDIITLVRLAQSLLHNRIRGSEPQRTRTLCQACQAHHDIRACCQESRQDVQLVNCIDLPDASSRALDRSLSIIVPQHVSFKNISNLARLETGRDLWQYKAAFVPIASITVPRRGCSGPLGDVTPVDTFTTVFN